MRALILIALAPSIAVADPRLEVGPVEPVANEQGSGYGDLARTLTLEVGQQWIGGDAQTAFAVAPAITFTGVDQHAITDAHASAQAELRTGTETDFAGRGEVSATADYDVGAGTIVPLSGIWASAALGDRPALAARRDLARDRYTTTNIGFRLTPLWGARDRRRAGALRFGFGGSLYWQAGDKRGTESGELELGFYCRLRDGGAPGSCIHVLQMDALGVSGRVEAVVSNVSVVRITGIGGRGVYVDGGIGFVTNGLAIGIADSQGNTIDQIATEDLPLTNVVAWNAGVLVLTELGRLDVRTRRTGYVTLDGEMSIDDRAELVASGEAAGATWSLSGFVARTRWWATKLDPGRSAATRGAELALARRILRFDLRASAGVARTFYPVLDGDAADEPVLGFRSQLAIARALDL